MTLTVTDFLRSNHDEVNRVVDLTDKRLKLNEGLYSPYFPRTTIADELIVLAKFRGSAPRMVQILAEGQEPIATRKRAQFSTVKLTDFRMGFKHLWTLDDLKMIRKLNDPQNANIRADITAYFLTTIGERIRDLNFTGDRLAHILTLTGFVDYTDPISRLRVRMDYRDEMNLAVQLPSPLVGAAQWTNPTTATPLSNLRDWSDTMYRQAGPWERPTSIHISYDIAEAAKKTTEVKLQVQKLRGYYSDVLSTYDADMVTDQELRSMFLKYAQVPDSANAFFIDDKRIEQEQADGTTSDVPFFSDQTGNSNYVRFGYGTRMVEQCYIPVPENEFRPGIYTKTHKAEDQMNYNEWFGGLANMIPVIEDPRKIFAIKVAN